MRDTVTTVIIFFLVMSTILVSYIGYRLFRSLPNTRERLKLIIPVLAAILIAVVFYLFGWVVPSCRFGRFM